MSLSRRRPSTVRRTVLLRNTLRTTAALWLFGWTAAMAESTVSFENIADDPSSGIEYTRTRSVAYAAVEELQQQSLINPIPTEAVALLPHRSGGFPGLALIDHDGDGDLDIYVTNGPGTANSLFVNQLAETGTFTFVDEGDTSGAAATDQDSNGVCFGDLDNDGDDDLLVLGRQEANRLFANDGSGQFHLVSESGLEGGSLSHIGCAIGDVDGDGLLDVFIGNAVNLDSQLGIVAVPFDFNEQNLLYRNDGGLSFTDISDASGVLDLVGMDTPDPQPGTITWSVAMVDVDLDGDLDIMHADDQAAVPSSEEPGGGFDRGLVHLFLNDGTGHFTDQPVDLNDASNGAWMGLSYGDLNCDGAMDFFSSNLGDYAQPWGTPVFGFPPYFLGEEMSRWLLGNGDGTFTDPLGDGVSSVFGWGSGIADLDNDGDQDIVYHGGLDMNVGAFEDNPGVVLENQGCSAAFIQNVTAFRGEYRLRGTHGVALGDLDQDGRIDVVTTSEHNVPASAPLGPSPAVYGNPDFDGMPGFWLQYIPDAQGMLTWGGVPAEPGNMTVEINTTSGSGGSVFVKAVGSVGVVDGATVNRSGIGAVVSFTPRAGHTAMSPVLGGSSYLSQNALEQHFGLGDEPWGVSEIRWPGGVRNRLYLVRDGERVVQPEIPCSIDTDESLGDYARCVGRALLQLRQAGVISKPLGLRLLVSAIWGYQEER